MISSQSRTPAWIMGMRGSTSDSEYAGLLEGFKKLASFIYSGYSSLDTAILCEAKVAYLVALLLKHENIIDRFESGQDISSWMISNPDYSKLNNVKKTSPEAFFYYFRALELSKLVGK